jgi:hypothetical protein
MDSGAGARGRQVSRSLRWAKAGQSVEAGAALGRSPVAYWRLEMTFVYRGSAKRQ